MPSRAAFFSIREILCACRSQDRMLPVFSICMAAAKLLPPGAAQQSSTRMPGAAPEASTASFCGGVLHIDCAGLEQRQRFEIARAGDEEAAGQPRVRLTGDPRFVQRSCHLLCRCLQGICLKRRFGNVVVGGEEGSERFLVHGSHAGSRRAAAGESISWPDRAAFPARPFCGKGAQRTVDQTGGAFVRIGLRLLDRFIDGGRDGDLYPEIRSDTRRDAGISSTTGCNFVSGDATACRKIKVQQHPILHHAV